MEHELDAALDAGLSLFVGRLEIDSHELVQVDSEDDIHKLVLALCVDGSVLIDVVYYIFKEAYVRIHRLPGPWILKPWMELGLMGRLITEVLEHLFEQYPRLVKCFLLLPSYSFSFLLFLHLDEGLLVTLVQSLAWLAPLLANLGSEGNCPCVGAVACDLNHCLSLLGHDLAGSMLLSAHLSDRLEDLDTVVADAVLSHLPESELAARTVHLVCLLLLEFDLSLSDSNLRELGFFTVTGRQVLETFEFWFCFALSSCWALSGLLLLTRSIIKEVFEEVGTEYESRGCGGGSPAGSLLANGVHF